MKKILLVITSIFLFNTAFAQYKTLYTSVNGINFFKKVHYTWWENDIYFQPTGLSGAPCSTVDPDNSNIFRLNLYTGKIYRPFNGMLDRFICEDINGGCYPVGFNIIEASQLDTSWVIGHRKIIGNPNSNNCNNNLYTTVISTNGGESFTEIFSDKNVTSIALLKTRSIAVIGIDSNIYRSTNGGASFNKMGIVPGLQSPILLSHFKLGIIIAAGKDHMYKSLDSGVTFEPMNVPKLNEVISSMYMEGTYYGVSDSFLYKGTSFGSNWTPLASFSNVNCLEVDHYQEARKIYVGTENGFYVSTNYGYDFSKSNLIFPESNRIIGISQYMNTDTLIICTEKSIHKVWDLQVGINQNSNTIPSVFKMHQNYPNPFNPTTNIKFDLPEKASVSLVIFDITGKEVSELVNTSLTAGEYTYTWDAFNLPSGIYFARISAESSSGRIFSESKRLILLK